MKKKKGKKNKDLITAAQAMKVISTRIRIFISGPVLRPTAAYLHILVELLYPAVS